jgi:hypothetical protein
VTSLKTICVTDEVPKKLTCLLGKRMAKTGTAQTFNDVVDDLIAETKGKS